MPAVNSAKDSKDRFQIICGFLVCPNCQSPLTPKSSGFACPKDGLFEKNARGVPLLIEAGSFSEHQIELDRGINWLKSFLKQFPALYYAIWNIFCPVLQAYNGPKKIFKEIPKEGVVLDVGSGPYRWDRRCVNVDVSPFPEVDLVADAEHLPFPNASVDAVVSESLLEHVDNPSAVAKEMLRVVKSGGVIYASAPFLTPYHASPDDFTRWTTSGLRALFAGAEIIETGVRSGPWSAFLVFLAYWLGVIFAFGSKKAAPFLAFVFMLVLGPLKIFDLFFAKLPGSETVSAQLYILCRKK
ncbi:MAG: hypothetical protein A3H71_01865 [Candidatus Sungbacteria bacterium RIFCSPLOWO2_02_FULL_48_13b]|uniref:Methyltransferase type 11 domain-containing protein n=1 Tax=Candidatus Sungbacteria bacterium RIFCSPLOWO2_02_FULL_48_13b TaxID=1802283 RepID=A0A1G2LF87_9BACT|nr:MAG: hypothetical protein A3H71_01865 [Candidatus Sungbacteria bacterium RIFCSPLOWO2_02_FULL_48_13b]